MNSSLLDSFFPNFEIEYHDIPLTKAECAAIAHANRSTTEKIKKITYCEDGIPILDQDGNLIIRLQKKYNFTNYQTVLQARNEQPFSSDFRKKYLIVAEWLLERYGNGQLEENGKVVEITDQWQAQVVLLPHLREKYITSQEMYNITTEMFVHPFVNEKIYDITALINVRFPESNWLQNDTENLPESLLVKLWHYATMENQQWVETEAIEGLAEAEDEDELLGESLEESGQVALPPSEEPLVKLKSTTNTDQE